MDIVTGINTIKISNLLLIVGIGIVVLAAIVFAIIILLNFLKKTRLSIRKDKKGFEISSGQQREEGTEFAIHEHDKVELMILMKKVAEWVLEKSRIEFRDTIKEEMVLGSKAVEVIVDSIKKTYLTLLQKYYPTSGLITEDKYKYFSAILGLLAYKLQDDLRRTAQENGLNKMSEVDFNSYVGTRIKTFKKLITDEIDLYYCWKDPNRVELYEENEKDWDVIRRTIVGWLEDCRRISIEKSQVVEELNKNIENSIYSFFVKEPKKETENG